MPTPNIVYILADDLGYGDLSCYNPASRIPTPHLDRLGSQGIRFTDAHASSSVCTPSRYSILTGRYCWRSSLRRSVLWPWDGPLIEPGRPTVAGLLRDHGYRTACIGKWHLGWQWVTHEGRPLEVGVGPGDYAGDHRRDLARQVDFTRPLRGGPVDHGFDTHFGIDVPNFPPYAWFEQDRLTALPTEWKPDAMFGFPGPMVAEWSLEAVMPEITRRAVRHIEQADEEPFFLYFALTAPHTPVVPTAEFRGRSRAGVYGDFVCQVDDAVGQVMAALERRGIAKNTVLIFTSDNGPEQLHLHYQGAYDRAREFRHYSMAHLRGAKRDTWEGGHRVPLIVRWPESTPTGTTCSRPVELGDFMATCADLIGAKLPPGAGSDGVSMLPLIEGRFDAPGREVLVHHSCDGRFALRRGDWVFIDGPSGGDVAEPDWLREERGYVAHAEPGELFNLKDDPSERVNQYRERSDLVSQMRALLQGVKGSDAAALERMAGPSSE